jgi:ubiquitin C-terminal hydrolase
MQLRKFRAFLFSSGLHPEFHVEKIYNQHDASALLEVLLKVTNATSLKMQQTLYKSNENKTLQKELKFTLLPLPIKEIHKNVLDLVKDYFNNQPATEEKCLFEGDQEKAPYNTQMQLIQVPSLLVVHLLRFNNDLNKINHPITLSPTIDLKEFVIPSLTADIQYEMTGYITHENNSIYSGHYVAYVKRGEYYWRCNDMLPSPVESITQEEFFNYKSAYLVLFKRSNL